MIGFEHTFSYATPCDEDNKTFACGGNQLAIYTTGTLSNTSPNQTIHMSSTSAVQTTQITSPVTAVLSSSTLLRSTTNTEVIKTVTVANAGGSVSTVIKTVTLSPSSAGVSSEQSYTASNQIALSCGIGIGLPFTIACIWLFIRYPA